MNKDDMSDDAEFDAFLKGEGALARGLHALPQPEPGAALDAAILQRARELMAQEARPEAANDAGDAITTPRMGRLSWRWRVPAGIAATLLAGVFARQAFQASQDMESRAGMPAAVEEKVLILAPATEPSVQAPPAELNMSAPGPVLARPASPSPPPPPVVESAAAPAPQVSAAAPPMQRVEVTGTPARRTESESASPITVITEPAPIAAAPPPPPPKLAAVAPAPAPAAARSAPSAAAPDAAAKAAAAENYAGSPAHLADSQANEARKRSDAAYKSGSAKEAGVLPPSPAAWLDQIEAMLGKDRDAQLLEEWRKFRQAYPHYPVPQTTVEHIEALQK